MHPPVLSLRAMQTHKLICQLWYFDFDVWRHVAAIENEVCLVASHGVLLSQAILLPAVTLRNADNLSFAEACRPMSKSLLTNQAYTTLILHTGVSISVHLQFSDLFSACVWLWPPVEALHWCLKLKVFPESVVAVWPTAAGRAVIDRYNLNNDFFVLYLFYRKCQTWPYNEKQCTWF